jgi:SAM-dependent methyltransferase
VDDKRHNAARAIISILRKITPPILEGMIRSVMNIGRSKSASTTQKPDQKSYTTTANPAEVPVQKEAYFLALNKFVKDGDRVLDVGCGLGYGMNLLSIKAGEVIGVDVDQNALDYCLKHIYERNPKLKGLHHFDGYHLPFKDKSFDVVTCIDVIEHVEFYQKFIVELIRVSKRVVFISTPNRRPEYTNSDGTPKNYYHLRELTFKEFENDLRFLNLSVSWHFINGAYDGPFSISLTPNERTQALVPVLNCSEMFQNDYVQ